MPVIHSFKVPKKGYAFDECEDSYSYSVFTDDKGLFSISDGAGEAAFSREWSDVLARETLTSNLPADFTQTSIREWFSNFLPTLYENWKNQIPSYEALPWYGQNKLVKGSSATLLVMRLLTGYYQAFAVGDSCLFHIRDKDLINGLPVTSSTEFDTHPYLVHTRHGIPKSEEALVCTEASYKPGDTFILSTDALSSWLFAEYEANNAPWTKIANLPSKAEISQMMNALRDKKEIRNDDIAMLVILTDSENLELDEHFSSKEENY